MSASLHHPSRPAKLSSASTSTSCSATTPSSTSSAFSLTRRHFIQGGLLAGLAAVALPSLTACGNAGGSDAAGAVSGRVIRWGISNHHVGLDTQKTTQTEGITEAVCEPLIHFNKDLKLEPVLCTKLPEISSDGKTYSFELKKGVTFHDGSKLTADDVKYTFERMFTPATKSQVTDGYDYIVGAKEMLAGKANSLAGFKQTDDLHFSFTLTEPRANMLPLFAELYALILPRKATSAAGDSWGTGTHLVGTGPFKMVSNDDTTRVILKRYESYHAKAPEFDTLDIHYIDDQNTKVLHFKNGDIDVTDLVQPLLKQYRQDPQVKDSIHLYDTASTQFINLNLKSEDLKDIRVRKALSLAINRQELCDTVLSGAGRPASQFAAPGEEGYNKNLPIFEYNPSKAKQLLSEAGKQGLKLTAKIRQSDQKIMVAIQNYWKQIGVNCKVEVIDPGVYFDQRAQGTLQVTTVTWSTLSFMGAEHLRSFFTSEKAKTRSSFYSNPKFDQLINEAIRSVKDEKKRVELTQKADAILCREDYGTIPICYPGMPWLERKTVSGVYRIVTYHFENAKVSDAKR